MVTVNPGICIINMIKVGNPVLVHEYCTDLRNKPGCHCAEIDDLSVTCVGNTWFCTLSQVENNSDFIVYF